MTDPTPRTAGGSLPPPTFFDPSFERIPATAAPDAASGGPLLVLFDPAADRAWVADATVALATGWAAEGRRTFLMDLSLDDPVLHERIGMANQDGVVDVFLYGASLARSARPVPGRGFYLVPAGTYTEDPESVLRHARWAQIVSGFREAGAALLLFVPANAAGLDALAARADGAMVLAERVAGDLVAPALDSGVPVRAWLAPPPSDGRLPPEPAHDISRSATSARFPEPEPAPPTWEALRDAAVLRKQTPEEEFLSAEETVGAHTGTLPVPDPAWEAAATPTQYSRRKRGGEEPKRSPIMLILLGLVLLAALAYLAYTYKPELFALGGGAAAVADGVKPAPAGPPALRGAPPAEAGARLPYAVSVANFADLNGAQRLIDTKAGSFPEARFYIVPEDNGGRLYFKVFAGMMADTAQAAALRQRLVDAKVADPDAVTGPWDLIQPRHLAYDLGVFTSDTAAANRAEALLRKGVPTYTVPVPFADGTERWRLYGGAYRDSLGARGMGQLLAKNQVSARLVERTGRPPAINK
jgi:hypothetical protein